LLKPAAPLIDCAPDCCAVTVTPFADAVSLLGDAVSAVDDAVSRREDSAAPVTPDAVAGGVAGNWGTVDGCPALVEAAVEDDCPGAA
jgi:hypothetical protein